MEQRRIQIVFIRCSKHVAQESLCSMNKFCAAFFVSTSIKVEEILATIVQEIW